MLAAIGLTFWGLKATGRPSEGHCCQPAFEPMVPGSMDMANIAKFFKHGHGHPGQGVSAWDYEQAMALCPGCPCVACVWQAMVRHCHVSFLEKEIAYQQDVLVHPPGSLLPEGISDWQAYTLARITALREEIDKVKGTIQAIDGPLQGQAKYNFERLSQLGLLGNWPDRYTAASEQSPAIEQSPASPAATVAPMQPWSPSPPPESPEPEVATETTNKRQRT